MENEKLEILEKISGLFFRYGIKSVSMDDVARELGISKKTLYKLFKDKRDVVEQAIEFHEDCSLKEMMKNIELSDSNAMEEYFELLRTVKKWVEEVNPSFEYDLEKYYIDIYRKHEAKRIENMTSYFTCNLNRGKAEGVYREDFDVDIITRFHVTTINNLHNSGLFSKAEIHNYKIYKEYFLLFMRGVASAKGLKILEEKIKEYDLINR